MNMKKGHIGLVNKGLRFFWQIAYLVAFRVTPVFLHPWRIFLLRLFGAKIKPGAHVYPSAKIWAPWNLVMEANSCLANNVDCYNVAPVTLGEGSVVSQYSFLCTASRDYKDPSLPLMIAPITIGPRAWIAADVYVGPGVDVGGGSLVAARTSLFKDVPVGVLVRQCTHLHEEVIVKRL
jgi:putative colanic acid biosynthesis acetyltransferase WcaF